MCKTGQNVTRKTPYPLPQCIPWLTPLITGSYISSAMLRTDGKYEGYVDATTLPIIVPCHEIDWDIWRSENVCPSCGERAIAEPMVTNKVCEHCGVYFSKDGIQYRPPKGAGNRSSRVGATKEYCEGILEEVRVKSPHAVIEFGRCGFMGNAPLWHKRDEDHPPETLWTAIREKRLVGIDDHPDRSWIRRLVERSTEQESGGVVSCAPRDYVDASWEEVCSQPVRAVDSPSSLARSCCRQKNILPAGVSRARKKLERDGIGS